MREINLLSDQVRQTAYEIHAYHGHGHLEKIYENALAHRLRKAGFDAKQQHPIEDLDEDGTILGEYYADLCVERELIIEVKAAKSLATEHEAQILGYLKSCRIKRGLLINFGSCKFEIRKYKWGWELSTAIRIIFAFVLFAIFVATFPSENPALSVSAT